MDMRRGVTGVLFATLMAGHALADHPGAMWSVDRLEVRADGATEAQMSQVRAALRQANETYFYGDRPVRMLAVVAATGAVQVDVIDAASGDVLIRGAQLARMSDVGALQDQVLAWMDGLECRGGTCGTAGQTLLAAVEDTPDAPVKAMRAEPSVEPQVAWPQRVTGVLGTATVTDAARQAGVPTPRARPTLDAPGLDGLRRVALARNPDPSVPPIRISRFDTRGLAPISYSADDRMVVGEPRALAPATQVLPQPQQAPRSRTLFGRLVDNVASFFGVGPGPEEAAPLSATASATTAVSTYAPRGTPLRPTERWKANTDARADTSRVAALDQSQVGEGTRIPAPQSAVALPDTGASLLTSTPTQSAATRAPRPPSADAAATPTVTYTGVRIVPSPGLGLPNRGADPVSGPQVTPIRVSPVTQAQAQAAPKNLAVKIHPEVFGRFSAAAAERLFGSYGRPNAPVRLVSSESGAGGRSVDSILASRGLALDSGKYAKAERVFWSGRSGSRGFWISMPQVAPSTFVLVASAKASVIANVYPRGSAIQVSDAVANALGLTPGQWSDVQIIALKSADRTAATSAPTITR